MSDELMIRHCSPTLAGIKTGSLFTCPCRCRQRLTAEICRLNRMLVPKGLRVLPLRIRQDRALIYVYRPRVLARDLQDSRARDLLVSLGYVPEQAEQCVIHLIRRLAAQQDFPHEIGLFLSYPPEDVLGFIRHGADCAKCVGCWKVYGDEETARTTFARYQLCTRAYDLQWRQGSTLQGLTVAV